jgi:ABC-type transport system substrate-binding protein
LELAYYPTYSLNPYKATNYVNRTLFSLVYQGLFAGDSHYQAVPILCKDLIISEDMRTYSIYLEKATFSDGSRVTIEDVRASYQTAMNSAYYSGRFTHVNGMSLTDDGGITFYLDTAMENFALLLDIPIVKAEEVDADRPIGSGPYYYDNAAGGLRLRRQNDWWCSSSDLEVTASSIPLTEVSSPLTLRDSFEFSNVGLACADPCADSYVEYRCDYELWDCDNGIFLYLSCNMESKVFSNATLRAALTYAIDRQTISDTYYRGYAQAASLPTSPSSPYYSKQLAERYDYDIEKFNQVMTDTYMMGREIRFIVNKDDTLRVRVARHIAQTLRDCGLNVTLDELSTKGYLDSIKYNMYDLYLGQTRLSPNMDLTPFFRINGKLNYGGISSDAIYAMCQQALANSGNYYNLHETIMKDGRICPVLFYVYSVHATRGLLTGIKPARDNVFHYTLGKTIADVIN